MVFIIVPPVLWQAGVWALSCLRIDVCVYVCFCSSAFASAVRLPLCFVKVFEKLKCGIQCARLTVFLASSNPADFCRRRQCKQMELVIQPCEYLTYCHSGSFAQSDKAQSHQSMFLTEMCDTSRLACSSTDASAMAAVSHCFHFKTHSLATHWVQSFCTPS